MRDRIIISLPILALAALTVAGLSGCGSSGGSSSSSISTTPASSNEVSGDGEPSKQFLQPQGENTIVKFGKEAPAKDREAASPILDKNLRARAAGDWAEQCATLSPSVQENMAEVENPSDPVALCARGLKKLGTPLSKSAEARADHFDGVIDAMRLKGPVAYALFHGTDGSDYAIPLELQRDGRWAVGSIETLAIG